MNKKTYRRKRIIYNLINVIALAIVVSFIATLAPILAKSVDVNDLDNSRADNIEDQYDLLRLEDYQGYQDFKEDIDYIEFGNDIEEIEDINILEVAEDTDNVLNIVVFGDSIWDIDRGETNLGSQLERLLQEQVVFEGSDTDINVYNLSVGGTCAAIIEGPSDLENWNSQSLPGMIHVLDGDLDAEKIYPEANMLDIYHDVKLVDTDLFIYAYGLNDYFFANEIESDNEYDLYTYKGSIRKTITDLQNKYPSANHLIISPTYCQFYYQDEVTETCEDKIFYKNDNPGVTLDNYVAAAEELAEELGIMYLDAYHDFDLGADTQNIYSRDGIHFNEEGRLQYAQCVLKALF